MDNLFEVYYNLGPTRNLAKLQEVVNVGVGAGIYDKKYTLMELERLSREEIWESKIGDRLSVLNEKLEADTYDKEVGMRQVYLDQKASRLKAIHNLRSLGIRMIDDTMSDIDNFRELKIGEKLRHLPSICKVLEVASKEEREELNLDPRDADSYVTPDDILRGMSPAARKLVRAELGIE